MALSLSPVTSEVRHSVKLYFEPLSWLWGALRNLVRRAVEGSLGLRRRLLAFEEGARVGSSGPLRRLLEAMGVLAPEPTTDVFEYLVRLENALPARDMVCLYLDAASHWTKSRKLSLAEALYRRVIELGDDEARVVAWLNLGAITQMLSRYREAEELYTRVLHAPSKEGREPEFTATIALARLALLYASQVKLDEMQGVLKALEARKVSVEAPELAETYADLAAALARLGHTGKAFEMLDRASMIRGRVGPRPLEPISR